MMRTGNKHTQDIRAVKSTDGVELQYEILGDGEALVLLHGGMVGRSAFGRMREDLSHKYKMILPSSRGHDGTALKLPVNYGFDTSEVSDLNTVLNAEQVKRVHLIGHSSGGCTAFAFARDYPEKVKRLILIEPTLVNILPPADLNSFAAVADKIFAANKVSGVQTALRISMDSMGGSAWDALNQYAKSKALERLAPMAPFVAPHWRIILNFGVTPADLETLKPPTLLLYGSNSFDFEASIAAVWQKLRPDLELIVIEGAGHNVHHDRPDIINPTVIRFLDGGS